MNFATQLSCWPSLWLSVDCQNWIGIGMSAWNSSILSTQFDFSNWNRIKLFKLSVNSNPQTINCNRCRKTRKSATVSAVSAVGPLVDRVGFPGLRGTARYHTFVTFYMPVFCTGVSRYFWFYVRNESYPPICCLQAMQILEQRLMQQRKSISDYNPTTTQHQRQPQGYHPSRPSGRPTGDNVGTDPDFNAEGAKRKGCGRSCMNECVVSWSVLDRRFSIRRDDRDQLNFRMPYQI